MNNINNKLLLLGYKFMSVKNLRQPGFLCSACRPFTTNKQGYMK